MKHKKTAENKENRRSALSRIPRGLLPACAAVCVVVLALLLYGFFAAPARALTIPGDYGISIDDLAALETGGTYEGIICTDKENKQYNLTFDNNVNGLVTLARISHTNSLERYKFNISLGATISLGVNYNGSDPVSEGSFFGIGNDEFPFMGTITVGGSGDTAIQIKEESGKESWHILFNNLSNEAVIKGDRKIYPSSSGESGNTFVFAKKLTITKDGELKIGGFRFGTNDSTGTVVKGSGAVAVFAGEIVAAGGSKFSVDLSQSITGGAYTVESSDGDAAGIIGTVTAGVHATVKLPASVDCTVTTRGNQQNAGILVGSNHGTVVITGDSNEITFTGTISGTGSSGLIGANQGGSEATFENDILVSNLTVTASGLRAGAIAGTCKGPIHVQNVKVQNAAFATISDATARVGGLIGSVDLEYASNYLEIAEDCKILLSGNTIQSPTGTAGGFIGYLKTGKKSFSNVTVSNLTMTGSGTVGGYIGVLDANGDVTLTLPNTSETITFDSSVTGTCGGVIGSVTSQLQNTVSISGTLSPTIKGTGAAVGGVVGKLAAGYLDLHDLTLTNDIVRHNNSADVVGEVANSAVLEIRNLTLKEQNGSVLVGKTGQGSVVRLNGTIQDHSASVVNLVYQQDASVIYLDVDGTYTGNAAQNNDIGNYGQVIRNDVLQVITLNADHTISIDDQLNASGDITLRSREDFAKLAITFHTKGSVSGVTGATYEALFGKTITLAGDINLSGTGIEQLTPSNDLTKPFTGTLNGGGHTITLAIGENIRGGNNGVQIGTNNARTSMGLFAAIQDATIENLTLAGNVKGTVWSDTSNQTQYFGALAGQAKGSLTLRSCGVSAAITLNNSFTKRYKTNTYVGGMVGEMTGMTSLTVTGCNIAATITDSLTYTGNLYNWYGGGLAGSIAYTGDGTIDLKRNTISTQIEKKGTYEDVNIGGLVGKLTCTKYVTVDLTGTSAQGVSVTANGATVSSGGILGNTFDQCHVIVNRTYNGTVSAGSASLGGLIHTLNGRMTVGENFTISGTFTATGANRGLLLADGKNAWVAVKAVPENYANVTAEGFDLLVGENIQAYTSVGVAAEGGIVTVETGGGVGKMPVDSGWYARINDRSNPKTRYYFNIEELTGKTVIGSATDLLYWHVYDYAALPSYVREEKLETAVSNITATADIDMNGYCFYPTKKESVAIDFDNHTLTFGKTVTVTAAQFYGLQAGLLSDVTAAENSGATVSIRNVQLAGTVSYLNSGDVLYHNGSGALICGTVHGAQVGNNRYTVNMIIENVVLSGITVETTEDYRPLLINRFASFVDVTISGITQAKYENTDVASSLIGRGGVLEGTTPSSFVKMTLESIVLDGKQTTTIFTKATLFYDVSYVSGTGSIIYNFNLAEDWDAQGNPIHKVTYGAELSLNEDQRFYFDQDLPVRPDYKPTASDDFFAFQNDYLPYVLTEGNRIYLSVNRKGADFLKGWGTYENPYIIESPKQLEYLANLLSNPDLTLSDGWKINLPLGDWASLSTLDLSKLDLKGCYEAEVINGKLTYNDTELNKKVLLAYLAGAYYKLNDRAELTLSSNFAGIGSTYYPFHGVFHGNDGTVTMPGKTVDSNGYGFIRVANGCVVLKLTVKYSGDIILSGSNSFVNISDTSAPTAETLTTGLPHFGGVIAWVVGGDNQIQSVLVTVNSVTLNVSHGVCGGYVGLISGGGVLLDGVAGTSGVFVGGNQYCHPFVGRVLGGYAIAVDGQTYENGSDFKIPGISLNTLTSHQSGYADRTFTLTGAQDLLLFSFGINSGAFTGQSGYAYGETSLSRWGDYSKVGTENPEGIVIDDGSYGDDTQKPSLIARYFGVTSDLQKTDLTVSLTGTKYDMSEYGNGFRGMSGVYANSPVFKIVSFGGVNGNATIILAMDMKQYAYIVDKATSTEPDSIVAYGLFGRLNSAVTFQNLTLKGTVSVLYKDLTSDPFTGTAVKDSRSVGGLLGRSQNAVTVKNVSLQDMVIVSPDIAGGFVGNHSAGNLTVTNSTANKTTIKGKRHAGGVVGFIGNGENAISKVQISDSIVETRVTGTATKSEKIGTGGLAGYMDGGTKLTVTDCTLTKTAVVFYCNFQSGSSNVGSGGLVGVTSKEFKATGCTVDGCVIFSISNLDGTKFLYESNTSTDFLPTELKGSLIYNGEDQKSATILAYFLRQSSGKSGYSIGAAGGIVGVTQNNVTLTDCTVTSAAAPTLIIAHNDAAGLIGEQRTISSPTVRLERCKVCTENYDLYIVADTRAAGAVAYRSTNGTASYTANQVCVVGSSAHPVRIIQSVYPSTDAAGLFGELSSVTLTASNCQVSYCIIAGAKASGVCSTIAGGSTITLNNIHVSNNLIYAKKDSYAGGLFCVSAQANATITINGAYLGENWILGTNGAGGIAGNHASKLNADYLILEENVIRKVTGLKISDYSFAVNSPKTAYTALINTDSLSNAGLIAANNTGTVKAIAVSCSATNWGDTQAKNFGSGSGTVVYAAYGAWGQYKGFADAYNTKTPQQTAIEAMSGNFVIGGQNTPLYGDSITSYPSTDNTPYVIAAQKWWMYKPSFVFADIIKLNSLDSQLSGVTNNGSLPLLCLDGKTDETIKGYLNTLTGGGFESASGSVTIVSTRYKVNGDGSLTPLKSAGSVVYNTTEKAFSAGVYDDLEGEEKTITILSITFDGKYTMHIAVYYHRSVNIKTFVVPVAGEQYHIPSFLIREPDRALKTSVSFGSPFTLYIEYNYNDVASKLENFHNFNKQIELTQSDGSSDSNQKIEKGTAFILIDLNSETAAGYSYYTLVLTQDAQFVTFADFQNGDAGFHHISIGELTDTMAEHRVCADSEYIDSEKYLLVVFPIQNNSDTAMQYNFKAVIDEEQRKETNITVKAMKSILGQVSVWNSPSSANNGSVIGNAQFSNTEEETIQMSVTSTVTFPDGYVSAIQAQSGKVYATHIIRLKNSNNQYVNLPVRTKVTITNGGESYEIELKDPKSQITYPAGDLLQKSISNNSVTAEYTIKLDFSGVSQSDFYSYFSGSEGNQFTLVDTIYLSDHESIIGDSTGEVTGVYTAKIADNVKLAIVPDDNRYLGINLADPDDDTNSGEIDFSVRAGFDAYMGKTFKNATITFSVTKKVWNGREYVYKDLDVSENAIWQIQKGNKEITGDTLTVTDGEASGKYTLILDKKSEHLDLTNYRLTVRLTATAEDGTVVQAEDYFVVLVCSLKTEPEN